MVNTSTIVLAVLTASVGLAQAAPIFGESPELSARTETRLFARAGGGGCFSVKGCFGQKSKKTSADASGTGDTQPASGSAPQTIEHTGPSGSTSSAVPVFSASSSSSGNPKYVVAHHMVGNTYPYTVRDWVDDINLAHSAGIDAFALNIGADSWQPQRVADVYTAASQTGTGFKLFLSFDMSSLPCNSAVNAAQLRTYITTYSSHPNQFKYNSRVFASTFAGESCTFGQSSVPLGWSSQFTRHPDLTGQNAVLFVPSFFVDPATFKQYRDVMDGDFNWNSGWPIQVTTSFASTSAVSGANRLSEFIGSTDTDTQHLNGLKAMLASPFKKVYMAAVSPWFFTHYSPQSFDKNFIFLSDHHLYSKRWESIITSRDQFDIAEIITWNDYGESHYIGPIKGSQPNSQAWVDGNDHTGWLDLTRYYAAAYKTGSKPAIVKDQIIMWARTHPRDAIANDPVGRPANFELSEDALWAVILATAPSTVILNARTFSVPAGLTELSVGLKAGDGMSGVLSRDGKNVVELKPEGFTFNGNPETYNFNAFVVSS